MYVCIQDMQSSLWWNVLVKIFLVHNCLNFDELNLLRKRSFVMFDSFNQSRNYRKRKPFESSSLKLNDQTIDPYKFFPSMHFEFAFLASLFLCLLIVYVNLHLTSHEVFNYYTVLIIYKINVFLSSPSSFLLLCRYTNDFNFRLFVPYDGPITSPSSERFLAQSPSPPGSDHLRFALLRGK